MAPARAAELAAADVFVDSRYISPDTWYDADGTPFQPQVHYFVGGATKLYGAALYRLREDDFGELRHHDGISPAWPIGYDEMEPYYTLAEQLYQVHGARGEDPTEPPASAPYPFPAVSHEPRIQQLSDDLAAAGLHPFHAPCGVMLDEANMPYSRCVRCNDCDGFPCLVHAKSDAEVLGVRPALEHANVTLLTNARGRAAADRRGRHAPSPGSSSITTGARETVHRRHRGRLVRRGEQRQAAARVGQRHAPERPGQRLRPGRAQLHVPQQPGGAGAVARSRTRPCSRRRSGSTTSTSASDDFEYPMGNIQMVGKSQADDVPRREAAARRSSRRSGRSTTSPRHAVDFWLSTEDLPRPDNRVTLRARRQRSRSATRRPTRSRRSGSTRS